MTEVPADPNCIDIAVPFRDELALRPDLPEVHIMAAILQTLRRASSLPHSKRTLDVGPLRIKAGSV